MRTRDDDHATDAEIEAAVAGLSPEELARLERSADFRARALRALGLGWNGDDLLQEAMLRTFDGRRKWKKSIRFMQHLKETMRSIASHVPDELRGAQVITNFDYEDRCSSSSSPEDTSDLLAMRMQISAIRKAFASDAVVLLILDGLEQNMSGPDIQSALGITQREYETAMTRLRRGLRRTPGGSS